MNDIEHPVKSSPYATGCNISHIAAICHGNAVDMLHSVAKCHIAVDMSNRGKICPHKMKQIF